MKFVPDARDWWRWASVRIMAVSTAAPAAWLSVPEDMRDAVPAEWLAIAAVALGLIGIVARVIDFKGDA